MPQLRVCEMFFFVKCIETVLLSDDARAGTLRRRCDIAICSLSLVFIVVIFVVSLMYMNYTYKRVRFELHTECLVGGKILIKPPRPPFPD